MSPDIINALFEFLGGALMCINIHKLHREKMVRGVHWSPTMFFACWGMWNLFYYPHLGQWWSFGGGCFIVVANSIWVTQMVYYRNK